MYSDEYLARKLHELREKEQTSRTHHNQALHEIVAEFLAQPRRRRPTRRIRR